MRDEQLQRLLPHMSTLQAWPLLRSLQLACSCGLSFVVRVWLSDRQSCVYLVAKVYSVVFLTSKEADSVTTQVQDDKHESLLGLIACKP